MVSFSEVRMRRPVIRLAHLSCIRSHAWGSSLLRGEVLSASSAKERIRAFTIVNDGLRTTSLCLATDYGAADDPRGREGIAHLLEHLLLFAPTRKGPSFSEHVSRQGGYCNAETHADGMVFSAQVHPDDADAAVESLLEAVFAPRLDEVFLEQERETVLQELTAADSDPSDLVQRAFAARVFEGHPLASPVGGLPESVEALTIEHVLDVHRNVFLDRSFTLVAVGPRELGAVRTPENADTPPASPSTVSSERPSARPGGVPDSWAEDFVWMCAGSAAPPVAAPERAAYHVLEFMLGSRSTSMLYQRLRVDRQLAYVFESWYRGYGAAGSWSVIAGAESRNCDAIVLEVRRCLEEIASGGYGGDFFETARKQAAVQVLREAEAPFDLALSIARKVKSGYRDWDLGTEIALIENVTPEDVSRAAARTLEGFTVVARPEPS